MTSSRQNKNRISRRTPTATSTKRNSTRSTPLATSVNTPSTPSATPAQLASHVDQIPDLPKLPNKNNASLEEQLKQQQLLIDKLTSCINALESHVQLLQGKIAIQETIGNLLEKKTDDLEIERNIDKLHRVGRFGHETQTQPIIVKFRTHNFKEKI